MWEYNQTYLCHHGVLGMHWGHQKTDAELGRKTASRSKASNIDQWGKDENHNILYVTGLSGSGKSTIAKGIQKSNQNVNVIHLDPFFEKMDKNVANSIQDKEFVQYLNKNFKSYKDIPNSNLQTNSKTVWDTVDGLMTHTEKFAKQQYHKGKKVVVEGVQLMDETTYPNKNFFKDKPIIMTGTNVLTSYNRARVRDGRPLPESIQSAKEYMKWYSSSSDNLKKISEISNASVEQGKKFVDQYLSDSQTK